MTELPLPRVLTREDFDTDEEYRLYLEVESGEWGEAENRLEETRDWWKSAARATLEASKTRVSLSIPDRTLRRLKARAEAEGVPYRALINDILDKWLEGRG